METSKSIEAEVFVKALTFHATVSVPTVAIKRFMLGEIASAFEGRSKYQTSREQLLANIADYIVTFGFHALTEPSKPEWFNIPGGFDQLLNETTDNWGRAFSGERSPLHLINVQISVTPREFIQAYAYALETDGQIKEKDDAGLIQGTDIVKAVVTACTHLGTSAIGLLVAQDVHVSNAKSTIASQLPFLLETTSIRMPLMIESLEF